MGTGISAFIEYDSSHLGKFPAWYEPFTPTFSVWNLEWDYLNWNKDYQFFAAIAGIRREVMPEGFEPLFPPRGLPKNCHSHTADVLDGCKHSVSWLTASEVREALDHASLSLPDDISPSAALIVETLELLTRRCGPDRARIVFGFD